MVDRNIEERLDLMLMEIHANHPIRASGHHQVRHQLRADRDPWLILPVLPGRTRSRGPRR